ncbi:uncharacterized protein LOC133528068 isoform X1 [Cydia pomonella]|uniref:uncharacterized protein LOC133528068 isoform X1 n=1 Tax=Cydia pomonella TaxID=82600 RepID=UPI002ADE7523|nr:uncharacterized protein LOC133528068 isoform X1 [Cydia pomonella]
MVKRTRTNSNDYECIARKVKKLERMLIRARRKRSDRQGSVASLSPSSGSQSSSSSSSSSRSRSASPRPRHRAPSRPRSSQEPIIIEDVPDNEQESSVRVIHPAPVRPTERLATPLQMRAAESPAAPAPPLTRRSAPALLSTSAEPAPTPQLCVAQEQPRYSPKDYPGCRDLIRRSMMKKFVPESAICIMLASLSNSSLKQYDSCLKKWFSFCINNQVDVYQASVPNVISFLTDLYHSGAQYGTLNSCRSALSLILGADIGNDNRMKRFFKGIFRLRPPLPKYSMTWDTSVVLNSLANWYPNATLNLEKISKKLVTLLALTTAHRVQTLSKINIKNIEFHVNEIHIKIPDLIKTSRVGVAQPTLVLPYFRERPEICPCAALHSYLDVTKSLRSSDVLFVSLNKPHRAITSQTLSRWIKNTLQECGIDISIFTAHSTRHAATSRAHRLGVNLDVIRKTAGWSGTSSTFGRFYNRIIVKNINSCTLARSILNDSLCDN